MPSSTQPVECAHRLVALIGNPNTGKTTLFNALTGYRQQVGNYPGVTVDRKVGLLRSRFDHPPIDVVDLPGAYTLAANSADEAVVLDVLLGRLGTTRAPDLVVIVADASQLTRNLFLVSQVLEVGIPAVVAVNMVDLARESGILVDTNVLASELGVPVVPIVATRLEGIDQLVRTIVDDAGDTSPASGVQFPECVRTELTGLRDLVARADGRIRRKPTNIELLQTLLDVGGYHEQRLTDQMGSDLVHDLAARRNRIRDAGESVVEIEARIRYAWIDLVVARAVRRERPPGPSKSEFADRFLTHRVLGPAVLVILMGACFQSIYTWAVPLMDGVEFINGMIGAGIEALLPVGALRSLLVDGVVAGVGAVLVFLPQILILFLFLAILEDCGYMARAAFLLDRWMALLGLNGKSFIPLMSSFACAVPGIMAARTIEDRNDRLVTILVAPLMSCSARLPVYILLISAFVPAVPLLGGVIGLQAAVLIAMYMIGVVVALGVAWLLRRSLLKGKPQPFLMELPTYKWPAARTVLYRMYEQGKAFCTTAGTIIFAMTIIIWAMGYYPRPGAITANYDVMRTGAQATHDAEIARIEREFQSGAAATGILDNPDVDGILRAVRTERADFAGTVERKGLEEGSTAWTDAYQALSRRIAGVARDGGEAGRAALAIEDAAATLAARMHEIDVQEHGEYLRASLLGRMGKWIEPAVEPLGWDWRLGTAAIAAFPAREVVIATVGILYNLGADQDEHSVSLRERLRSASRPDGRPVFNLAVAFSLMVFFALCCQCGGTLATIKRETKSWRWPIITFVYMTTLAYAGALLTYQVTVRLI